jgi:hypothetical protein
MGASSPCSDKLEGTHQSMYAKKQVIPINITVGCLENEFQGEIPVQRLSCVGVLAYLEDIPMSTFYSRCDPEEDHLSSFLCTICS